MNKSLDTKNHILDSANELFYQQGYHHTGFGDIEKKTGLSRGNITYHFKNKKNILQEIVVRRLQQIKSSLAKYDHEAKDPKDAIVKLCEDVLLHSSEIKKYGCPMGTLISEMAKNDEDIHEITIVMFQTYIDWLEIKFIELGNKKSLTKEMARSLLARLQGVALMAHALGDARFFKKEIEKIKNKYK
jgi:AcrR family transcriptional regulator